MNILANAPSSQTWTLEPQSEYRFELEQAEFIAIQLTQGQAEIFGAEIAPNRWYHFMAECKAAVFTWEGCQLEMTGTPSTEYVSHETTFPALSNLHLALEGQRLRAHRYQTNRARTLKQASPAERAEAEASEWMDPELEDSPRLMVLGPEGSGKTTVCKTLINWTVRAGRESSPLFVNLDPSEGPHSPPGALSLTPIAHPLPTSTPAQTFGSPLPTGPPPSLSSTLLPLSWWYGYQTPGQPGRSRLWQQLVQDMGEKWETRRKGNKPLASAGLIVDTNGKFVDANLGKTEDGDKKEKYTFVREAVDAFKINILLVIGHEKLHMEMQRMFGGPNSRIKIVKLSKSAGVVDLDRSHRVRSQALQIKSYFYGDPPSTPSLLALPGATAMNPLGLSPHSTTVKFEDLSIWRVGEEYIAPSSALPIGSTRSISETQLVKVDPTLPAKESHLLNVVLALIKPPASIVQNGSASTAVANNESAKVKEEDEEGTVAAETVVEGDMGEELAKSEIIGYVVVTNIDIPRKRFTILSPNMGRLPSKTALRMELADLRYQLPLKLSNSIVYWSLVVFHIWNSFSYKPEYPPKETYLTPGKYAFWVWPVIHILLIGYTVVQFFPRAQSLVVDSIRWRFVSVGVISAAYLYFQIRKWYILAFLLSVALLSTVSSIFYLIRTRKRIVPEPTKFEIKLLEVTILLPFSLYHAWSIVLMVLTFFQAFGKDVHKEHAGAWTRVFVWLALLFLTLTSIGYAFASEAGDLAGCAVLTYVLWAIFENQEGIMFIHWSGLVFAIISSIAFLYTTYKSYKYHLLPPAPPPMVTRPRARTRGRSGGTTPTIGGLSQVSSPRSQPVSPQLPRGTLVNPSGTVTMPPVEQVSKTGPGQKVQNDQGETEDDSLLVREGSTSRPSEDIQRS
ncbi:mRNA cleavage and polyadenylation factor IA/II complex, subunit CLP1 [Phaffia rhodozyma]|uniref:Polynucleotide 5'-hydroxyl-kinase GRC3 n=1 Tax=Phaffia rhodozyma TaxID=264483 RepID=A0A0F7SQ85_PHARH|nr:mRNA cleavage and polyadenylation factor IA/II complex, subunit CLP1 [Phaffia rhodozyma]